MSAQRTQGRIFWGLMLICLGVLFLLDQMGTGLISATSSGASGRSSSSSSASPFSSATTSRTSAPGSSSSSSARSSSCSGCGVFDRAVWHYIWPLAIIATGLWLLLRPALAPGQERSLRGGRRRPVHQPGLLGLGPQGRIPELPGRQGRRRLRLGRDRPPGRQARRGPGDARPVRRLRRDRGLRPPRLAGRPRRDARSSARSTVTRRPRRSPRPRP